MVKRPASKKKGGDPILLDEIEVEPKNDDEEEKAVVSPKGKEKRPPTAPGTKEMLDEKRAKLDDSDSLGKKDGGSSGTTPHNAADSLVGYNKNNSSGVNSGDHTYDQMNEEEK